MPLGFASLILGGILGIAGITGSSIASIVQGKPDRKNAKGLSSNVVTGITGTSAPPSLALGNEKAVRKSIISFFMAKGLTRAQAAGIAGNAQQESGLNPNAPGGGLLQDIGSRSPSGQGTLGQQLDAAWKELLGPESNALAALRRTRTPAEAARVFSELFERPGVPMLSNRERYAQEAYSEK